MFWVKLTKEAWPGCAKLPDFRTITFAEVKSPTRIASCLPNGSNDEVALVQRLVCYDLAARASTAELLQHKYFRDEPLPVPVSELPVPLAKSSQDEDSSDDWNSYNDMDPDSDFDFGPAKVTSTNSGFSIQFPGLLPEAYTKISSALCMVCSKHVRLKLRTCSTFKVMTHSRSFKISVKFFLTNVSHKRTQEQLSYLVG